ncbi:MAG: effector-associated domain EAD1-containing protein [Bacteroidota bacterium]
MAKSPYSPENIHALLIGIGKRERDHPLLAITAKDAERLGRELQERCGLKEENIQLILEEESTKEAILQGLDELAAKTRQKKAELVWVFFSGHGGKTKDDLFSLVARDTVGKRLTATGILGSDFLEKLKAVQTNKLLVLLDCCHAGGLSDDVDFEPLNIPFDETELLRQNNRVLLCASHYDQYSFVSEPLSLFTYALVEGLAGAYFQESDRQVKLFDLAMYVRERVVPLSNQKQQPQLKVLKESLTSNFVLAEYENGKPEKMPFDEDFELTDEEGKQIETSQKTVPDEAYRAEFAWIKNDIKIDGDGNIVTNINGESIVINNSSRDEDLLALFKAQQAQMNELIDMLKRNMNPQVQKVAQKLSELNQERKSKTVKSDLPNKLNGQEKKAFRDALLSAYPDLAGLKQMLSIELDKNLASIVGDGALKNVVFDLIQKAEAEGWVPKLIKGARTDNPDNEALRLFEERQLKKKHNTEATDKNTNPKENMEPKEYNLKQIDELLNHAFSDTDLNRFCMFYFEEVHSAFAIGQIKTQKVTQLIQYAKNKKRMDQLIAHIEEENPAMFAEYKDKIYK